MLNSLCLLTSSSSSLSLHRAMVRQKSVSLKCQYPKHLQHNPRVERKRPLYCAHKTITQSYSTKQHDTICERKNTSNCALPSSLSGSLVYEKLGERAFGWPGKIAAFGSIIMQNIGGEHQSFLNSPV